MKHNNDLQQGAAHSSTGAAQHLTANIVGASIELAREAGYPSVAFPREEWDALSEFHRNAMTRYGKARGIRIDTY